jgi:hypothetical protein
MPVESILEATLTASPVESFVRLNRLEGDSELTPDVVMQLCRSNDTGCDFSIIEADSKHKVELEQIAIKAFYGILHGDGEIEQCIEVLVRVGSVGFIQAAGAHVSRANCLDLLDAFELIAQQKLVEIWGKVGVIFQSRAR